MIPASVESFEADVTKTFPRAALSTPRCARRATRDPPRRRRRALLRVAPRARLVVARPAFPARRRRRPPTTRRTSARTRRFMTVRSTPPPPTTHLASPSRLARARRGASLRFWLPRAGWPQMRAAVEAGADAVYFGLNLLNARARAEFRRRGAPRRRRLPPRARRPRLSSP